MMATTIGITTKMRGTIALITMSIAADRIQPMAAFFDRSVQNG
jgi:hypothetical protein